MATQARLTLFLLNLVLGPAQDGPAQILYWLCVSSFPSILNTWWDLLNDNAFLPSSRYGTCAAIFLVVIFNFFVPFFLRHLGVEPKQKCLSCKFCKWMSSYFSRAVTWRQWLVQLASKIKAATISWNLWFENYWLVDRVTKWWETHTNHGSISWKLNSHAHTFHFWKTRDNHLFQRF